MNNRKCLECEEPLLGRADQKFCNDQCRSSYNNRQSVESNLVIRIINRILKKNYFILSALNSGKKAIINKSDLQKKGYRFDYYTGTHLNSKNHLFYYCYDQGFTELENNKVMLVCKDLNGDLAGMRIENHDGKK
ncbi:MAG: hypothetical protein WCP85_04595 [Mariniphaga sp.]